MKNIKFGRLFFNLIVDKNDIPEPQYFDKIEWKAAFEDEYILYKVLDRNNRLIGLIAINPFEYTLNLELLEIFKPYRQLGHGTNVIAFCIFLSYTFQKQNSNSPPSHTLIINIKSTSSAKAFYSRVGAHQSLQHADTFIINPVTGEKLVEHWQNVK